MCVGSRDIKLPFVSTQGVHRLTVHVQILDDTATAVKIRVVMFPDGWKQCFPEAKIQVCKTLIRLVWIEGLESCQANLQRGSHEVGIHCLSGPDFGWH